jgi:hypothetical protein
MNWTKSTYSVDAANCVEVGTGCDLIQIRNSQHPGRATLAFPARTVADFVRACTAGELDDLAGA